MTNSTDVSDVKMTRFGNRVDLFRERHVRVKDEAKIASRGTDWSYSKSYYTIHGTPTPIYKIPFNGFALISRGSEHKGGRSGPTHSPVATPLPIRFYLFFNLYSNACRPTERNSRAGYNLLNLNC